METKEQCKNCEIINADCEGCKEFNKNIRNPDLEAKEQRIERLKKAKNRLKMCCKRNKHRFGAISLRRQFKIVRQQLKELEDDLRRE